MTERELMAEKAKGTVWEAAYRYAPPSPPITEKELAEKARKKANNDKHNALRAAKSIKADTKQKANWKI